MTPYLLNEAFLAKTHNLKHLTCHANAVGAYHYSLLCSHRDSLDKCADRQRTNYGSREGPSHPSVLRALPSFHHSILLFFRTSILPFFHTDIAAQCSMFNVQWRISACTLRMRTSANSRPLSIILLTMQARWPIRHFTKL